ncbi:uncharacterized protein C3orf20 isoform X2 [Esox lucius]|uniref:Uncharacterized protein n=1 Tax=Esox lucius TaxID=8010 RepID=A0A6Q2X5E1_ESOLU|nr:uncharacterized protein C3orf20 isoform X2 [Esox lucius]
MLKDGVTIQVSDQISVRLLSGTCALLVFRGQKEMVQLPLSPLSRQVLPKATGPVHSSEGPVRAKLEKPCPFQRAGRAGRELTRLQRRVFKILDDWLEFYRNCTGIKCPDKERMPDGLVRPRQKRVIQSTPLGSLNPTKEMSDSTIGLKYRDSTELQTNPRHLPLTTPADVPLPGSTFKLSRTLTQKKKGGEKRVELLHFCQPGTSRIHNDIKLDSGGNLRRSPELHPIALTHHYPSTTPCGASRPCPAQLRAILLGEEGPNHRRCHCSSRLMPLLTDLEYDAFIQGQPPHSEQILVVCVTPLFALHTSSQPDAGLLDRLYQRRNRNRTMPCYQSQLDSFRLVRYELSAGKTCPGTHNALLQQRHNVAPGMFLMYIRGKLLFADYIFNGYSCSVGDLQKQISKTRAFYRMGQSLPPDYRFSGQVNSPIAGDSDGHQTAQKASGAGGHIHRETRPVEIPTRKSTEVPLTSPVVENKNPGLLKARGRAGSYQVH